MNELATRVIEITPEGVNDFSGTYDEYLARAGDDHLDAQEVLRRARESKRAASADPPKKNRQKGVKAGKVGKAKKAAKG